VESPTVQVQGLDALLAAFKQLGEGLPHELSAGLRTVARDVANDAKAIAKANGLHASGNLIDHITTSVRGTVAYIVDNARRVSPKYPSGYLYPAVYEFGHGGARAFLHPAAERDQDKIVAGLEPLVDRLIAQAGF